MNFERIAWRGVGVRDDPESPGGPVIMGASSISGMVWVVGEAGGVDSVNLR